MSYAAISLRTVDRNIVSPKYQLCTELIDLLLPKCIYCMLGTLIRIDCETSLISIQNIPCTNNKLRIDSNECSQHNVCSREEIRKISR